jgi:hypothetical protein
MHHPGSSHIDGVVGMAYCATTRYIYAYGSSYLGACVSGPSEVNCVDVWMVTTGQSTHMTCDASPGQTGCNTPARSDANVQSQATGSFFIDTNDPPTLTNATTSWY